MLRRSIKYLQFLQNSKRTLTHGTGKYKVTVVGANGGIGQPLSLLLKHEESIAQLALYDIMNTNGMRVDLSHIDTPTQVTSFTGKEQMNDALNCSDIVVMMGGAPRKPGMNRVDLFHMNAKCIVEFTYAVIKNCPNALLAIVTNPINAMVPLMVELMKSAGLSSPGKRVMGFTTLDLMRARSFLGEAFHHDPREIFCPVIGGHSNVTMLPCLSACQPKFPFDESNVRDLTARIQNGGAEVLNAKKDKSATLSAAVAAHSFIQTLLNGLSGCNDTPDYAYVESEVTDLTYFGSALTFGKEGVESFLPLPELNKFEQKLLESIKVQLKKDILKGVDFSRHGR